MKRQLNNRVRKKDTVILFASALILTSLPASVNAQSQVNSTEDISSLQEESTKLYELNTYDEWLIAIKDFENSPDKLETFTRKLYEEYMNQSDSENDLEQFIKLVNEEIDDVSNSEDYIIYLNNWILTLIEESIYLTDSELDELSGDEELLTLSEELEEIDSEEVFEEEVVEEGKTASDNENQLSDISETEQNNEEVIEEESVELIQEENNSEDNEDKIQESQSMTIATFSAQAVDSRLEELIIASETGGASSRWHAAIEGYKNYPNEIIFQDNLRHLAGRMISLGNTQYSIGNYEGAELYYNRILNGPVELFSSSIINDAENKLNSVSTSSNKDIKNELLISASTGGASSRWHAALEGYNLFPNEVAFHEHLRFLAGRMISLGNNQYAVGDYEGAALYFNRVINGPVELFPSSIINEAESKLDTVETSSNKERKNELLAAASTGGASSRWHAALEGYNEFPNETAFHEHLRFLAGRMISLGNSQYADDNYQGALLYYDRVSNGPVELFNASLISDVNSKIAAVEKAIQSNEKNILIEAATSGGASSRWHAALEGYAEYPDEVVFQEQLRFLSGRMMTLGKNLHSNGDFNGAAMYYNRIINGPVELFDSALVNEAKAYLQMTQEDDRLVTRDSLLAQASSGGASSRWHAALEGYELFPNDSAFHEHLVHLSQRMMSLGNDEHKKGNFDNALTYYRRITNGPTELFSNRLVENANVYRNQAESSASLVTRESIINRASTGGASARYSAAIEGYKWFNTDAEIIELVRVNGKRLLDLAVGHHNKGEFQDALTYYNRLSELDENFNDIQTVIRTNRYFAENNLYLVNSIYYTSNYAHTLEEMLDIQMGLNPPPQTDIYGGGWQDAKREDAKRYLDPSNFIDYGTSGDELSQQIRITTSNLNVRTQPNTSGSILGQVHLNQVYDIQAVQNGWYQISFNDRTGWISGSFTSPISAPREFSIETTRARVTASSLNVRSGPGTNHSVISSTKSGDILTILGQRNEWLNIRRGSIEGWVHSDFVNFESSINRDALQFLILSGSSGISVEDMNRELQGKGILEGQGAAFVEAARLHNINEIYLLSHALLETGHGGSELATGIRVTEVDGKPVTPKVVYNMFGIGAFDATAKKSGSEYAYKQGWDTPEKSIIGGAEWISRQYVNHPTYKQDTLYKMRWNPSTPGAHQYATDMGWAFKQTRTLEYIVEMSQKYNFVLRFDIPLF